jgi:Ca2+-binding EF-hand superfamily protein
VLLVPAVLTAEDGQDTASPDSALFDRLDADKDGQLTPAEIPADKRRFFERLLRIADRDGSGGLSRAEFLAGVADGGSQLPLEEKPILDPANPSGLPNPDQFFERFDKNKDGKVTADEVPEEGRDRFQQLLTRADKDNDGAVSKEEMTALVNAANKQLKATAAGQGRDPQQMFKYLDTDGDGKVALDEVPGERREGFEKMLKAFDKDGDGKLNEEEFVTGMRFVQSRQAGTAAPPTSPAKDDKPSESKPSESKPSESKSSEASDAKEGKTATRRKQLAERLGKGFDPDKMAERIMQLDKNKDGKISREEAAGPLKDRFDVFDANKDGFLDETEVHDRLEQIQSAVEKVKAIRQRKGTKSGSNP